jgi:hypothetical protein
VEVEKDGSKVCGTSIMGLMMLAPAKGRFDRDQRQRRRRRRGVEALTALVRRDSTRSIPRGSAAGFRGEAHTCQTDHRFLNPLVKQVRGLREKKHRARRLFVARAAHPDDARETGRLPEILLYADTMRHKLLSELIDATEAAGGEVIETNADIIAKVTGKDNPQAVVGAYRLFATGLCELDRSAAPLWIVAQALRDPGNLGTILRTGDAVGAGGPDPGGRLCGSRFRSKRCGRRWGPCSRNASPRRPGKNSCRGCAAGPASWSAPASRRSWITSRHGTSAPASSWSATNNPGCPRPMPNNAICW